tara:strand:+ start:113 stop:277 length:165 start_codon:yes stop_codon:yes gene_type:complete
MCHSNEINTKQNDIKRTNKIDPLIIKNKDNGSNTKELMILLINSLLIKYYQNFF